MALLLACIRVFHSLRSTPETAYRVDPVLLFPKAGLLHLINPSSHQLCRENICRDNQAPVLEAFEDQWQMSVDTRDLADL